MAAPSETSTNDSLHFAPLSKDVQKFLRMHPSLNYIGTGKVRCDLTGHEMPCNPSAMKSYTNGRKYQRLQEYSSCDFEKYKPHIVPSKKKHQEHQLFCTLTLRHISRLPVDVERHIKGKKYRRALAKYNECQSLGVPFKPCGKIPRKDRMEWDFDHGTKSNNTDSEASEAESDDSMSDLLPAADFQTDSDKDGDKLGERSEDDVENMDVSDTKKNVKQNISDKKRCKSFQDDSKKAGMECKKSGKHASFSKHVKKFKHTR